MELFTQRDFDNTIKAFLDLAKRSGSGSSGKSTGNAIQKQASAGNDLQRNTVQRKKKLGEVSHVSPVCLLTYMTSCDTIVQVFDAFDLDGDGAVDEYEFSLLAKIKRKITGDPFLGTSSCSHVIDSVLVIGGGNWNTENNVALMNNVCCATAVMY